MTYSSEMRQLGNSAALCMGDNFASVYNSLFFVLKTYLFLR